MADSPRPQHLLSINDIAARADLLALIAQGQRFRADRGLAPDALRGKSVALIFEKPSTRTRVSFEVGIHQLGGTPIVLNANDMQLKRYETLGDTAQVLSRYVDAIIMRTTDHARLEEMAAASTVPVINSLSDREHPCQILADLMVMDTHARALGGELSDLNIAWLGDINNVTQSMMKAAELVGMRMQLGAPERQGNRVTYGQHYADPQRAVMGADIVVTDTWHSMHDEQDAQNAGDADLPPYQVTEALMEAAKPGAIFMHCLPAHRGEEVTAEVIDGPQSRVWDEAENRLHAQKALLQWLLTDSPFQQ